MQMENALRFVLGLLITAMLAFFIYLLAVTDVWATSSTRGRILIVGILMALVSLNAGVMLTSDYMRKQPDVGLMMLGICVVGISLMAGVTVHTAIFW